MLVDEGLEILTEECCRELLERETIGRVAISVSALPHIFPVNYRLVDGDVLFLTGDGLKSRSAIEGNVVGFEVDHIDPEERAGWSVLVVGRASLVPDEERVVLGDLGLFPWAGGVRSRLVRIHPEFCSGRRIAATPRCGPAESSLPRPAPPLSRRRRRRS